MFGFSARVADPDGTENSSVSSALPANVRHEIEQPDFEDTSVSSAPAADSANANSEQAVDKDPRPVTGSYSF